jgi:hypothetical protein
MIKFAPFLGQVTHPVFCEPEKVTELLHSDSLMQYHFCALFGNFDEKAIMKLSSKKPLANLKT